MSSCLSPETSLEVVGLVAIVIVGAKLATWLASLVYRRIIARPLVTTSRNKGHL
jgi:hypothetical protein